MIIRSSNDIHTNEDWQAGYITNPTIEFGSHKSIPVTITEKNFCEYLEIKDMKLSVFCVVMVLCSVVILVTSETNRRGLGKNMRASKTNSRGSKTNAWDSETNNRASKNDKRSRRKPTDRNGQNGSKNTRRKSTKNNKEMSCEVV